MKYTKIEIIFDRDHRTREEGWYMRTTDTDGQQEDQPVGEDWWEDALVSDAIIRAWALKYFRPADATDEELEELEQMIEIKR